MATQQQKPAPFGARSFFDPNQNGLAPNPDQIVQPPAALPAATDSSSSSSAPQAASNSSAPSLPSMTPPTAAPMMSSAATSSSGSQPPPPSQQTADTFFNGVPSYDEWHQKFGDVPIQAPAPVPHHGVLGKILLGVGQAIGNDYADRIGQRDRDLQLQNEQYEQNRPALQYQANHQAYEQDIANQQKAADVRYRNVESDVAGQNLPVQEKAAEVHDELMQRWLSGVDASPEAFSQYAQTRLSAEPFAVQRRLGAPVAQITQLPQKPPQFSVKDNTLEPIVWKGANYGAAPSQNEPPEITAARNSAFASLQQSQLKSLDPIIRGQLGDPPTNDPKALADYMKKAEQIKTRMSAAPRVEMMMAKPEQVVDDKTGNVVYMPAGQAMKNGAAAPSSIGYQTEKSVAKDFTSGKAASTLNAFNTATEHLQQLSSLSDALHNGDTQMFNSLANKFATASGSAAPTNFDMVKNAVAGEIAKVFKGNATEGEISAINSTINNAMSPDQLKGAIAQATQLMASKRAALQQQYQQGMQGKPAFEPTNPNGNSQQQWEHTATGPNGHKIGARGGKWFDIQTGQPLQ